MTDATEHHISEKSCNCRQPANLSRIYIRGLVIESCGKCGGLVSRRPQQKDAT